MSVVLMEVEWYVAGVDEFDMPHYRTCDLCEYSATNDIDDPRFPEVRRFFRQYGGEGNGLDICESCLDGWLNGTAK